VWLKSLRIGGHMPLLFTFIFLHYDTLQDIHDRFTSYNFFDEAGVELR
jgi:hypothetical protein